MFSYAISDAIAAISAIMGIIIILKNKSFYSKIGAIGLGLMCFTSILGTFRFGVPIEITSTHLLASSLSTAIGLPLMGLSVLAVTFEEKFHKGILIIIFLCLIILYGIFNFLTKVPIYNTAIGGIGMLSSIICGIILILRGKTIPGILAIITGVAVLYGGIFIGTSGVLMGIERWHIFHALVTIANLAFAHSVIKV